MRVLVKTKEELLKTHDVIETSDGHIRQGQSPISFPPEKQRELCGHIVFCYAQSCEQERWNTITDNNTWTIEPWMIKETLVE